MSLDDLRFRSLHTSTARHHAAKKISQLQTELIATAQILAADEISAVMAHQLNEPLNALLIYLNEIKKDRIHRPGSVLLRTQFATWLTMPFAKPSVFVRSLRAWDAHPCGALKMPAVESKLRRRIVKRPPIRQSLWFSVYRIGFL